MLIRLLHVGDQPARRSMFFGRYTMLKYTGAHTAAKPLKERLWSDFLTIMQVHGFLRFSIHYG